MLYKLGLKSIKFVESVGNSMNKCKEVMSRL